MNEGKIFENYWDTKSNARSYSSRYIEISADWRAMPKNLLLRSKEGRIFKKKLEKIDSVLDIGCGLYPVDRALRDLGIKIKYESVDPDLSVKADYRELHSVHNTFDCIFMLELIEHLPLETTIEYFNKARDLLNEGGLLVLSTPNAAHPTHFWAIDYTHVRPYPAQHLVGLLRQIGYSGDIEVYRQFIKYQSKSILKKVIRKFARPIQKMMYVIMELDHAQSILVFARKESCQ